MTDDKNKDRYPTQPDPSEAQTLGGQVLAIFGFENPDQEVEADFKGRLTQGVLSRLAKEGNEDAKELLEALEQTEGTTGEFDLLDVTDVLDEIRAGEGFRESSPAMRDKTQRMAQLANAAGDTVATIMMLMRPASEERVAELASAGLAKLDQQQMLGAAHTELGAIIGEVAEVAGLKPPDKL